MFKRFLIGLMFVLAIAVGTYAQEKTSTDEFIRYESGKGLNIAVTDYVSPTTSQSVTLYGVVHIADSAYYKTVQADLDKFDVVLYEGVKPRVKVNTETKVLNLVQHLAGDVLGLEFQLDSIDYTRKNLVHADISMEDLQERMKGEQVTPLGQFLKDENIGFLKPILKLAGPLIKELMKSQPEIQNQFKDNLGRQLAQADIGKQLSPEAYESIIIERDKIVFKVMQEQFEKSPTKKTYAIFYGAAHMPDMQERLIRLGFKQSSKRWLTAWKVEAVAEPEDQEEHEHPAPTRPQQKRLDDRKKHIDDEEDK